MFIVCSICRDYFTDSDSTSITRCGHMFHSKCLLKWFDRSQSCPQCRKESTVNEISKVYLTFSTNNSADDVNSTITIDSLKFQLLLNKKYIEHYTAKNEILEKQNAGLRQEVRKVESEMNEKNSNIFDLKNRLISQLKMISNLKKELVDKEEELDSLKNEYKFAHDPNEGKTSHGSKGPSTQLRHLSTIRKNLLSNMKSLKKQNHLNMVAHNIIQTMLDLNHGVSYAIKHDACLGSEARIDNIHHFHTFCKKVEELKKYTWLEVYKSKHDIE